MGNAYILVGAYTRRSECQALNSNKHQTSTIRLIPRSRIPLDTQILGKVSTNVLALTEPKCALPYWRPQTDPSRTSSHSYTLSCTSIFNIILLPPPSFLILSRSFIFRLNICVQCVYYMSISSSTIWDVVWRSVRITKIYCHQHKHRISSTVGRNRNWRYADAVACVTGNFRLPVTRRVTLQSDLYSQKNVILWSNEGVREGQRM